MDQKNNHLRLVFFGTSLFAVPALNKIIDHGYSVVSVDTQPDQPAGRGKHMTATPIKVVAAQQRISIEQPPSLKTEEALDRFTGLKPDLAIVAAYGKMIPKTFLDIPPHGFLNIHPSLLPKLRGASPIQTAILEGCERTGVTIMKMDEGLDSGPILAQVAIPLRGDENTRALSDILARKGADLLIDVLPRYLRGELLPSRQDEGQATWTKLLRRDDGKIAWSEPAWLIERKVRAFDPWPGSYTFLNGKRLKILKTRINNQPPSHPQPPGTLEIEGNNRIIVHCDKGVLELLELQLEGKNVMGVQTFIRGYLRNLPSSLFLSQ